MDDRNDTSTETGAGTGNAHYTSSNARTRIGLDVGTSKVVAARGDSHRSDTDAQLNAFFALPYSSLHESTLQQSKIPFYR